MNNPSNWGLSEKGFYRPSFDEILDHLERYFKDLQEEKGKSPNITVRSFYGVFLRIVAWIMYICYMLAENVWNSNFADTAVGVSLFRQGKGYGIVRIPAQYAKGYVTVSGEVGTTVPKGFLFGTVTKLFYSALESAIIGEDGKALVLVVCNTKGSIGNVEIGKITEIINPLINIHSVTNDARIVGGRELETEEQFRDRLTVSVDIINGVNADALQSLIMKLVPSIISCKVFENKSDYTDSRGLPPHSVEAVVFGGADEDVARAVYKKIAGIQTHGNITVPVISEQNNQTYPIKFSRPVLVPIYVEVTELRTNSDFETNGDEQIKLTIIDYIGDEFEVNNGLNIGYDVILKRINCRVLNIRGVVDFNIRIGKSIDTLAENNIEIGEREKAVTRDEIITISKQVE